MSIFVKSSSKMYIPKMEFVQVWLFISYRRINLPNQKLNIFIWNKLSFIKFVCWAIFSCVRKKFDAYVKNSAIFPAEFWKNFPALQVLSKFYSCFKAPAETYTIFNYGEKCARRFVDHKYFSNFFAKCQLSDLESP